MARYFFHLHECGTKIPDEEGVELPNLECVRANAIREARQMMCAEVIEGRLCLSCHIEVVDARGASILSMLFKDAIALTGL